MKQDMVWTAYVMSGRVPRDAYMTEPMASWYGTLRILAISSMVDGDCADESFMTSHDDVV